MVTFADKYVSSVIDKLKLIDPDINTTKLETNLRRKIEERSVEKEFVIKNNFTNKFFKVNSTKLLEVFYNNKPIISGYNVLFYPKSKKENIPGKILKYILTRRKAAKHEMLKYTSEDVYSKMMYRKLDLEQSVIKVLANSYFGCFGEKSFHFYNLKAKHFHFLF